MTVKFGIFTSGKVGVYAGFKTLNVPLYIHINIPNSCFLLYFVYHHRQSTHIDKDHIHNHLIYNSVSFVDYKHFHSTPPSYYYTRRVSDRLCKEYGLSVITNPSKERGKLYSAVYSTDGTLKGCGTVKEDIEANNDTGVDITVSCAIDETDVIKTFMWSDTMTPLAKTAELVIE